jgi:hypothetical protein
MSLYISVVAGYLPVLQHYISLLIPRYAIIAIIVVVMIATAGPTLVLILPIPLYGG